MVFHYQKERKHSSLAWYWYSSNAPACKSVKEINGSEMVQSVIGYRDSHMFLKEEFEAYGLVTVATEDGSVGTKGNVLDAIRENDMKQDVIYACGPTPMLRALKAYSPGKRYSLLFIPGRKNGLRYRCLSGLHLPDKGCGRTFPGT